MSRMFSSAPAVETPEPAVETPEHCIVFAPPHAGGIQLAEADGRPAWAVCKPGTWRGMFGLSLVTEEKLQVVANSYDAQGLDEAAINFDHEWGGPAHGWVEEVFYRDGLLWVVPRQLSEELVEGIRSGRWKRASVEIDFEYEPTDDWYLAGLAILGNAQPAVKALPKITLAGKRLAIPMTDEEVEPEEIPTTSTTDPASTPGEAPQAEPSTPTDASPASEEEDPKMPVPNTTQGDQGAAPGADPQATGQEPTPATPTDPQPTDTQLAAARRDRDAELAAIRREREAFAAERREARRERAQARVERDLEQLAARVPPCMLRNTGLRELMIQLAAQDPEQQTTIQLAAPAGEDGQETTVERSAYDVLHTALAALPDQLTQLAGELAGEDNDPPPATDPRDHKTRQFHLAAGLKDDRLEELAGRYGREAIFGSGPN